MLINKQDSKILIVDDQASNLRFLSKILTQQGYKVQRAISGEMVLNAEFASPPDLILLDIVMPQMNGYEVCERLKANKKTCDIPVIFLSVLKEPLDKVKAFQVGGVDYISKPFQTEEVLARIENQLLIQQFSKHLKEQNFQLQKEIEERKQIEEQLQESQRWLQAITDANPNILYVYDLLEQRNIYINREVYTILGYTPAEVQNMGKAVIQTLMHPDDFALLPEYFKKFDTVQEGEIIEYDYRMQHKNGEWRWMFSRDVVFTRTSNGKPKQILGSATDITDHKKAKIAIQNALEAAQSANLAKSNFLASMSHELRTPLNAVLGFSQILGRDQSLTAQQKKYIDIINRSGAHLLNLINDVLSMSKIEAGRITLNEESFDLYALLNSLQEMLQLKAKSKGLQLNFKYDLKIPRYIQTDESKLRQVLINLLGNAIKFTQEGSVTLRVTYNKLKPKIIIFEISDTGLGISREELNSIFDPFVQTQTGRKFIEGTGLGLPISREFVQLMGGDISVSSTLGKGSTFIFDIEVKFAAAADVIPVKARGVVVGLEPNQPSYRILVAEDIEESRLLLVQLLERLGFEVQEAVNGQEAFKIWEKWQPHLILMDICMPIMDGYEAIKQIKKAEKKIVSRFKVKNKKQQINTIDAPSTITIALTASALEEQREAILKSGCDDFIGKPFPEKVLYEKIADHLGVRYVYQAENKTEEQIQPLSLKRNDFSIMPLEWQKKLHWGAVIMDDELIMELTQEIPESHSDLAKNLINLIDNFRLDIIIDCFKE
jgi:PAS domain S-box-containing protein